ncbi:MAG: hypothetical protein NTU43_04685 [Bacteroidetes bacterium]|nr:hypothetical protein [Bacteroidota bacterium]
MKKIMISTILLGTVIFTGCYYDKEDLLYPNSGTNCDAVLTYNTGIKTIIDVNCATSSCHKTGGTSPDLSTYTSVKANTVKITLRAITQKNMPAPLGMSSCNITKLDNWIKAGAKEN